MRRSMRASALRDVHIKHLGAAGSPGDVPPVLVRQAAAAGDVLGSHAGEKAPEAVRQIPAVRQHLETHGERA